MTAKPLHGKVTIDVLVGNQSMLDQLRELSKNNVFYADTIMSAVMEAHIEVELQLSCIHRTQANFQYTGKSTGATKVIKKRDKNRTTKRKV